MLLRSSSSRLLGSINPMLPQSEALKELEPESSLSRCKSAKPLSSSWAFGSGNWDLEAELHKSPPKSFQRVHKTAVVVDRMGSEKPAISGRKNGVLRPGGGGEEGSGSSPVPRNSQSVSETEDGAMYIAGGFGFGGEDEEVSTRTDCTEVYFQKMLEANPGSSLLLRNYAKFLHEVQGNLAKAEEYYERAILASPDDGNSV
uniref:TmcB/TmcC TPR repeats domain-containing protein n=1 Tax=Picea sitchensis TaxID=3332 RepID=C0PTH0_PICSI|nr:unknown [Picea sitchensis]